MFHLVPTQGESEEWKFRSRRTPKDKNEVSIKSSSSKFLNDTFLPKFRKINRNLGNLRRVDTSLNIDTC